MRLRKSQPDAPRYNEGLRTRLRDSTRRPQDERISESAKAIRIEMITVLSSNTEIVQAPARPNGRGVQRPATALTGPDPAPEVCRQTATKVN